MLNQNQLQPAAIYKANNIQRMFGYEVRKFHVAEILTLVSTYYYLIVTFHEESHLD